MSSLGCGGVVTRPSQSYRTASPSTSRPSFAIHWPLAPICAHGCRAAAPRQLRCRAAASGEWRRRASPVAPTAMACSAAALPRLRLQRAGARARAAAALVSCALACAVLRGAASVPLGIQPDTPLPASLRVCVQGYPPFTLPRVRGATRGRMRRGAASQCALTLRRSHARAGVGGREPHGAAHAPRLRAAVRAERCAPAGRQSTAVLP